MDEENIQTIPLGDFIEMRLVGALEDLIEEMNSTGLTVQYVEDPVDILRNIIKEMEDEDNS